MDAGALELHLRRLPGVVACQLTATEVVVLVEAGDAAAIRIAAQAALDQAGSDRRIRVLAMAPASPPVALWRRRRFAALAGAAGALSAGIAAASTLASMPGAVAPSREVIAVPGADVPAAGSRGVRTLVPAPAGLTDDGPVAADPATVDASVLADATLASAPVPAPASLAGTAPVPATPVPVASPAAPAAATATAPTKPDPTAPSAPPVTPEPGVVSASSDEDDDPSRGRGREGRRPHPHGEPPGYLQRAGHGPW